MWPQLKQQKCIAMHGIGLVSVALLASGIVTDTSASFSSAQSPAQSVCDDSMPRGTALLQRMQSSLRAVDLNFVEAEGLKSQGGREVSSQPVERLEELETLKWQHRIVVAPLVVACCALIIFCSTARTEASPASAADDASPEAKDSEDLAKLRAEQKALNSQVEALSLKIAEARVGGTNEEGEEPGISAAEAYERTDRAAAIVNGAVHRRVTKAMHLAAPTVAKAKQLKGTVEKGVGEASMKAKSIALGSASMLADKVFETLEIEFRMTDLEALTAYTVQMQDGPNGACSTNTLWDSFAKANAKSQKQVGEAMQDADGVPLPRLLAGLWAPVRLQLLVAWNHLQLILIVPIVLLLVGVMVYDVGRSCGEGALWIWSIGLLIILGCTVMARLAMLRKSSRILEELKHDGASWGGGIGPLNERVRENSGDFFKALVGYDEVVASMASRSLSILNIVYIIWGAYGVVCSIRYIEVDSTTCDALVLRFGVHFYAFLYVALLTFTVPSLVLWILGALLDHGGFDTSILRATKEFDDSYFFGLPCTSLLARSFLIDPAASMIQEGEGGSDPGEVDALQKQKAELQKQVSTVDSALSSKEAKLKAMVDARVDAFLLEDESETPLATEDIQAAAGMLALSALENAKMMGLDVQTIVEQAQQEIASETLDS